jgi:hypothetical protein
MDRSLGTLAGGTKFTVGDECDYNPFGDSSYWCAARVECVSANGAVLRVRFICGAFEISHELDLRSLNHQRRIAALGTMSVPMLTGMHVDVLKTLHAATGEYYQQWQRGAFPFVSLSKTCTLYFNAPFPFS